MATTQNTYTGNGSTTDYSITFEYLKDADVKVTLDHVATTAFTFPNATTLRFTTAPGNNVAIRIFRDTDVDAARFIYSAGSSIKAAELNENADQTLYGLQETANTDDITDQAVTTAKIRDGAVTTAKFANLSITTAQLVDSGVTTAKIADNAVTTAKIATNSITNLMIADDAVTGAKIDGSSDIAVASLQTTGTVTAGDGTGDKMIVSGLLGIQDTNPPQKLHIDEVAGFDVGTLSSSSTGQQTVDSFSATAFRTAKYLIQVHNTTDSDYQALELLLFHDGSTVYLTQYASIFDNGAQATFDADINSGNVRLRVTPASTDNMTFKVLRQTIEV